MAEREPTPAERVEAARLRLAVTLDAIDERLNVPKRARATADRLKDSYRKNPVPWIAGLAGAGVVIAGAIAWAVAARRGR